MLRRLRAAVRRWPILGVLCLTLFLSGCADYEVGIQFETPHQGVLTQHIHLAEQFTSLNKTAAQQWLTSIEQQARRSRGQVKRLSDQELVVTLPFSTGADLEAKFNEFFQFRTTGANAIGAIAKTLPEIQSHLSLRQNNLLLFVRNHLTLDIDLTALGIRSDQGDVLVSPGSLLNLQFQLQTPGGTKVIDTGNPGVALPQMEQQQQLIWSLQPGQLNHLEVVFWLPSPIGWGSVAIALLVGVGLFLKSKGLAAKPTEAG